MKKKIAKKLFLISIIMLFISVTFDFFYDTYNLIKKNYSDRMVAIYGNCSKEGYGFSKFIYEKYQSNFNYEVINGQPGNFVTIQYLFYEKNKPYSNNLKILVNYNKDLNKEFKNFKILENINNCYFIKLSHD